MNVIAVLVVNGLGTETRVDHARAQIASEAARLRPTSALDVKRVLAGLCKGDPCIFRVNLRQIDLVMFALCDVNGSQSVLPDKI